MGKQTGLIIKSNKVMIDKKGYGLIIMEDLAPESWEGLTPQQMLSELKDYNVEAFYHMAEDSGIDVALLDKSGYEYDGFSQLALMELEAFKGEEAARQVKELLTKSDYSKERDFKYVLHTYLEDNASASKLYPENTLEEVLEYQKYSHHRERESVLKLTKLFIEEFKDDKTEARNEILKKYDGRFIDLPELTSFLRKKMEVAWYRGDIFNPQYEQSIKDAEAMKELVALFRLISQGDEFQIKSSKIQHQKMTIKGKTVEILQDSIAYALKVLHDVNSVFPLRDEIKEETSLVSDEETELSPSPITEQGIDAEMSKFVKLADMEVAKRYVDEIATYVEADIEGYADERDLRLFYYLADNAITWPDGIRQTDRYVFLYKLASFFGYVKLTELDDLSNAHVRKEIVSKIKNQLKYYEEKDSDKDILKLYFS